MTMLEKIARAMVANGSGNPAQWDEYSPIMKQAWLLHVRAALAAMREPSDAMLEAALNVYPESLDDRLAEDCWQSMIDAILEGE